MSFAEIANQRLLGSIANQVGELVWDVEPDGYQRLEVPATADLAIVLRLLLRRGLEPALVTILLDRFANRPVERALIAWDVAAGCLLGTEDGALTARVREDVALLKPLSLPPSAAVHRDRVGALIEAVGAVGEQPVEDGAPPPSLASVAALGTSDTAAIEAALAFADQLALAHLPSFALAYGQILWARHALPAALDRIVEIALDYERFDAMPVLPQQGERWLERQVYFGMRVALAQLDTASAAKILAASAVAGSEDPSLVAARAELAVLSDESVDLRSVEAIAPHGSTWRYGSRVRDEITIQLAPADAAITVDGFLSSFGNDMRLWAQAGYHAEARSRLLALASREIRYQSHDPEAWRALAVFLDDGTAVELALQERSIVQLGTALG